MKSNMHIRVATPANAKGMALVHVASWQTTYRGIVPDEVLGSLSVEQREEMWRRGLTNAERGHLTLIAETEGRIVGFADGGPFRGEGDAEDAWELYAIYVLADFQRHGLGRRLWREILKDAQRRSAATVYVWVLADNHSARAFYQKCGFRQDGTEKVIEIGKKALTEIRYRLDLTG